jgi:hypothetical protein
VTQIPHRNLFEILSITALLVDPVVRDNSIDFISSLEGYGFGATTYVMFM